MNRIMLGLGAAIFALLGVPSTGEAQVPVVLVCEDGTTQPGSSRVSCADHGGMDWEATKTWTEMRAGRFTDIDTVVCTDGQARAAGRLACEGHGGVDSISTLAAVKRRADAYRYADRPGAPEKRQDSIESEPNQNPPGYRGMEQPVADSASQDSVSHQ